MGRKHSMSFSGSQGRTPTIAALALFLGLTGALIVLAFLTLTMGAINGPARSDAPRGTFRVLSYNVAGAPFGLSQSQPSRNSALISPKLSVFDLVLLQEDFGYHADLTSASRHAYVDTKKTRLIWTKDGLTRLSHRALGDVNRVGWRTCHGLAANKSDCLVRKGFSFGTMELEPGLLIHVYNFHGDAGRGAGDVAARKDQMRQLTDFVLEHSAGWPLIVAGDTNLWSLFSQDVAILRRFLTETGLIDTASHLKTGDERIDRVFFRPGRDLLLTPLLYEIPSEFTDSEGAPLSDHSPVGVVFEWMVR